MAYEHHFWCTSGGGPLIVLPAEVAEHWRGTWPPPGAAVPEAWSWGDPGGPVCDYDRACAVRGCLGMVAVGPGFGLVLGDEPLATTFLPTPEGGVFARWSGADEGTDPRHLLDSPPAPRWKATRHRLEVGPGGIIVIDSAYPGDRTPGWRPPYPAETNRLVLPLGPATYRVRYSDHRPDDRTHFDLVELRRLRPRSPRAVAAPCGGGP